MTALVKSWSFSRWMDYRSCPAKFKYKHIDRRPTKPSPQMERGTAIHKLAEDYALGKLRTLPKELAQFREEFKTLKAQKYKEIEGSWTYRQDWSFTTWNDWTGAWLRVKVDAAVLLDDQTRLKLIDHKTGRYHADGPKAEEYALQLELYGLAGLVQHPSVEVVEPELWYLDAGQIHPEPDAAVTFVRKDEARLKKLWLKRVQPLFADTTFKPTPNHGCVYCDFSKAKGGPCKF